MKSSVLTILILYLITNSLVAQTIEWERTISLPNDQSFIAIAEADSGFFGYGQGEDPTDFNELLKFDTSGNLLWRKPLGIGPITSVSGDMVKVPGEFTYYLSGFYSQGGFGNDFIAKVDTRGDTLWVYRYAASAIYQTWYKLAVLKDKSVLSVGYQSQPVTNEDIFVRRLDSLGNLMWEEIYSLPGNQRANDITEMLDGSMIISGSEDGNNFLLRVGFDGNLIDYHNTSYVDLSNFSYCQSNQKNEVIQTGTFLTVNNDYKNLNIFFDSNFINLDTLGIATLKGNIDSDSNLLVLYSDGSASRIRYINLNQNLEVWDYNLMPTPNPITSPSFSKIMDSGKFIVTGFKEVSNDRDYWLAKISGVGEEWIPDRCSYQPPMAGFYYEYNYPVLTLRDTSSGGLKYLDTVYTWQWNTSVGTNGTDDSLVVFFDTAITNTIDIELVIGNWYGCTDTVSQTLVLGETGLEDYRKLEVKVFPNPAKDILNVHIDDIQDKVLFTLYDLQGRLQFTQVLETPRTTISLSELPQGLYIYDIRSDGQTSRGKIVKN